MSIVQNSEQVRRKAQAAVATARLSGYKLISQARTEKARVAARALSDNSATKSQAVAAGVQARKTQVQPTSSHTARVQGKKVA